MTFLVTYTPSFNITNRMLTLVSSISELDEISEQISASAENVSEYVQKFIDITEYDMPYTLTSLMELLGLKSKI